MKPLTIPTEDEEQINLFAWTTIAKARLEILEPSDLIYLMREGSDVESDWFDVSYTDVQKIVKAWDEMFIKADVSDLLEVLDANKNGYEVGQRTFVGRFANIEYNPE